MSETFKNMNNLQIINTVNKHENDIGGIRSDLAEIVQVKLLDYAKKTEVNSLASSKADKTELTKEINTINDKVNSLSDGTPKGIYNTLAELKTAKPNYESGIYIAGGKWCYHDKTTWVEGGIYQSTGIANKSITQDMIVYNGRFKDKGIIYPLLSNLADLNDIWYNTIKNCLLDIKIENANEEVNYKFKYITKNQSLYGDLILIDAVDKVTGLQKYPLFSTKMTDYNTDGVQKFTVNTLQKEIVTLIIDWTEIKDGQIMNMDTKDFIVPTEKLVYSKNITSNEFNLLVDYNNNELNIYSKYNRNNDLKLTFKKESVNQLFAIYYAKYRTNQNLTPSTFDGGTILSGTGSDWISPHKVKAVNNGDGTDFTFTGGVHSDNGSSSSGNPTAITENVEIFVDGLPVIGGSQGGNIVDIYVTNKIMGSNTMMSKRYIVNELVHYKVTKNKIDVKVTIKPIEDVIYGGYYGQQSINNGYNNINYLGGETKNAPSNSNSNSGAKSFFPTDTYILNNVSSGDTMIVRHDNNNGLGKRENLLWNTPRQFTTINNKTYQWLIGQEIQLKTNNDVYWLGSYEFSKK